MVNSSGSGLALPERQLQRVDDQLDAQVVGDRPADTPAKPDVEHDGEVEPALSGAALGDVGDVQPIGLGRGEPPLHRVLDRLGGGVPTGAAAQSFAVHALQPG